MLTGFMGTGKSAVGRALAAVLGRDFVDTDELIVGAHGPIPAIFENQGEVGFRAIERELAAELAAETDLVIATGGGMLLQQAARDALRSTGRVFCLVAEPATIVARVTADGIGERPLLAGADPQGRIRELLAARAPTYGEFEQVATDGRQLEDIVADIVARLGED